MNKSLDDLLTVQEHQALDTFLSELRQRHPGRILDIVLFGSKARGGSYPASDIDLLILVDDDNWQFSHAVSTLAARISLNHDVLLGPRVISLARWPRSILYRTVSAEGISLPLSHQVPRAA